MARLNLAIYIFVSSAIVTLCVALPTIQLGELNDKVEAKLVAEIVQDIIAKVAHVYNHPLASTLNGTEIAETLDNDNATKVEVAPHFPDESQIISLVRETSKQVAASKEKASADQTDAESDDDADDVDQEVKEAEKRIPIPNLDPGSEYVLKVFEKLQKGNSMESATQELTKKLSREHRRKISSCNTVLSLPGSVTQEDESPEQQKHRETAETKHFRTGGKINFNLKALSSRNEKSITNRLALLALTINVEATSDVIPKVFYSTSFKMKSSSETAAETNATRLNDTESASNVEEDSQPSRSRRSPVEETFRETRVFKMDESRDNELWLDITREIPRWKRAFSDPESVMEITVTYFFPGGDVMSNEISVSTEDASLVIFSKDDQKLEELQQQEAESEAKAAANLANSEDGVNRVERRRRSAGGFGGEVNENHSSPTLFRTQRLRRRRQMRSNKRNGNKRRRLNKRRRNKAAAAEEEATRPLGPRVEKSAQVELSTEDEEQKKAAGLCHLKEYVIDFEVLGWDTWIIYPKKYDAYTCGGVCTSPIMQALHPTNHGMLQSLMQHKTGRGNEEQLCCVPSKLSPLSMLYMENGMVVTRHHPDMIVDQCACR